MANKLFKLSEGSLEVIMNGGEVLQPVMQAVSSKKINSSLNVKERYRILLSDGKFSISLAMLTAALHDSVGVNGIEDFSVIKLKKYTTSVINNKQGCKGETRLLLILDLEVIAPGSEVLVIIGNPVTLVVDDFGCYKPRSGTDTTQNSSNTHVVNSSLLLQATSADIKDLISKFELISPVASLSPFHNKWLIKARVTNKTDILTWSNPRGEGRLFSFELLDSSGDIRCTVFQELVDKYFNLIQVDKIYFLCKCLIKPAKRQFNSTSHVFELTITHEAVVELCIMDDKNIPYTNFNFIHIDKIADLQPGAVLDVLAICKDASNIQTFHSKLCNREVQKRELQLVDQSETSIQFILWGARAKAFDDSGSPVIAIKGTKIAEFGGGKTLAAIHGTHIKINPDITEAHKLRAWFDLEGNRIEPKNISTRNSGSIAAPWMTFLEVQDQKLGQSERAHYFQTLGTIIVMRGDNSVYKACPTDECNKKVVILESGMYRCNKCNQEYSNFKHRLLVNVFVADSSGSQWISMFSSEAEKVLGVTSQEMGDMLRDNYNAALKIFNKAQFNQYIFKCRAKMETYNDMQRVKTVVVRADLINYEEYNSYLHDKIMKATV